MEKQTKLQKAIELLEQCGHTITHNWTKKHNFESRAEEARADVNGVKNADALIVFMNDPNYAYRGTWTEVGIALGSAKSKWIYFVTDENFKKECKNVFFHDANIICCDSLYNLIVKHIGFNKNCFEHPCLTTFLKSLEIDKFVIT